MPIAKEYALKYVGREGVINNWDCTIIGYNLTYNLVIVAFHDNKHGWHDFHDNDVILVNKISYTNYGYVNCERIWLF